MKRIAVVCDDFNQFREYCKNYKDVKIVVSGHGKAYVKENNEVTTELYCITNQKPDQLKGYIFSDVVYLGKMNRYRDLFYQIEILNRAIIVRP